MKNGGVNEGCQKGMCGEGVCSDNRCCMIGTHLGDDSAYETLQFQLCKRDVSAVGSCLREGLPSKHAASPVSFPRCL